MIVVRTAFAPAAAAVLISASNRSTSDMSFGTETIASMYWTLASACLRSLSASLEPITPSRFCIPPAPSDLQCSKNVEGSNKSTGGVADDNILLRNWQQ